MICALESCEDFGSRPRELFCSPELRASLTLTPLAVAAIAGGVAAASKGIKYGIAGRSDVGKAQKAEEGLAAKRLKTPGAYGLTAAQKRSMIGDTVRSMSQQAREQAGDVWRGAKAKGALAGGQALQAIGQVGRGIASGAAQVGGKVAQLSTQVAQQQKAADIAAVQRAYARRVGEMKEYIDGTTEAVAQGFGGSSQALGDEGLKTAGATVA